MTNLQKIAEDLSLLTVMQAAELSKILEEKWGVSAAAPVAIAASTSSSSEAVAEKTSFNVILSSIGDNKINVIKAVKDLLGLGLAEAKALVDSSPAKPLKEGANKEEAEKFKTTLEAVGAKVELS